MMYNPNVSYSNSSVNQTVGKYQSQQGLLSCNPNEYITYMYIGAHDVNSHNNMPNGITYIQIECSDGNYYDTNEIISKISNATHPFFNASIDNHTDFACSNGIYSFDVQSSRSIDGFSNFQSNTIQNQSDALYVSYNI